MNPSIYICQIVSSSKQNSSSREGKDIYEDYSAADGVDFVNALANEDYIEMKDLLSSDGSASTSEFSSRRSEEYFDSDALLRELLNDQNTTREVHQDCNHNIAGPTKSDCMVISPPEQGKMTFVSLVLNLRGCFRSSCSTFPKLCKCSHMKNLLET